MSSQPPSYYCWLKHVEEEADNRIVEFPAIPQPQTPKKPMEFLSRSWSASANQKSKALATKHMQQNNNLYPIPQAVTPLQQIQNHQPGKVMNGGRVRGAEIGRLFHHKDGDKNKDKTRMTNAHMHTILSVAAVAAALASTERCKSPISEMDTALTSATQLLASYCIELAESAGADGEQVSSVVRSAVGIRTASDLQTLTAGAATALRGEAALKARLLPKETKMSAAVSPYEKVLADSRSPATEMEAEEFPCVGDLLQLTRKGMLRWRRISVYINRACQVTFKLKRKHLVGAFYRNNKCIVYDVIDKNEEWPFKKGRVRENMEVYFGVKTSQGLLEFKCKNNVDKQRWVYGIQKLLHRKTRFQDAHNSLRMLNISTDL